MGQKIHTKSQFLFIREQISARPRIFHRECNGGLVVPEIERENVTRFTCIRCDHTETYEIKGEKAMNFKANSDEGWWMLHTDLTLRVYRKHIRKMKAAGIEILKPADQVPNSRTFSITAAEILKNIGVK